MRKVALGFAIGLGAMFLLMRAPGTGELEKEAEAVDTVYVTRWKELKEEYQRNDSILTNAGLTLPTDSARTIIRRERAACLGVLAACADRTANRDRQIARLKPARLGVFGEANYVIGDAFDAKVGLRLNVGNGTHLQGFTTATGRYGIGVRKEVKLF